MNEAPRRGRPPKVKTEMIEDVATVTVTDHVQIIHVQPEGVAGEMAAGDLLTASESPVKIGSIQRMGKLKMLRPFGYIDDDGSHYWQRGQVVTDPVEIDMIVGRQCKDYEELT